MVANLLPLYGYYTAVSSYTNGIAFSCCKDGFKYLVSGNGDSDLMFGTGPYLRISKWRGVRWRN